MAETNEHDMEAIAASVSNRLLGSPPAAETPDGAQLWQASADEIMLDVWIQFAYPRKPEGYWAGGLSTLEVVENYLRRRGRLDRHGNPIWQATERPCSAGAQVR